MAESQCGDWSDLVFVLQNRLHLARRRIPEQNGGVSRAACDGIPVRAVSEAMDERILLRLQFFLPGCCLPRLQYCARCTGELFPCRVERHAPVGKTRQLLQRTAVARRRLFRSLRIPDPNHAIIATRGQASTVLAESQAGDRTAMALQAAAQAFRLE